MPVTGLIVLLCLILLTFTPVSVYGYSDKGAESPSGTDRRKISDNPLASNTGGSCTMTTTYNTIRCSNIPNDTGEFVANYINENSNNVSTCSQETEYRNYKEILVGLKR
jgi:hypothetical protein